MLVKVSQRSFRLYPSPTGRGGAGVRETIMAQTIHYSERHAT